MSFPERNGLRVLFCLNGFNQLGGPNVWLTRHLPRLSAFGLDVGVLYCTRTPNLVCHYRAELEAHGIPVREVSFRGYLEDRVAALCEALNAEKPDAVVANCTTEMYFAGRFAREAGITTFGIMHNDSDKYYDIADAFVTGDAAWRLSGIVTVSDFLHEWVAERCPPDVAHLFAPYGAPIPTATSRSPAGCLRLLYVGRLAENQKRILRLTARLIAAVRELSDVEAVLYGDGPERDKLSSMVVKSGVGERVRLGGVIDADASICAMLDAQAFVLLSDFEGFSVALMEAMACGLVPIVANTRSGSEILRDGENALIVDPGDETAFVNAVRRLRDEPQLWQRLSAAARQSIIDNGLTSDECARRWVEFLHTQCAGRPRPSMIVLPQQETWDMPPESTRADGIRHDDRRSPCQRARALAFRGRSIYLWGAGGAGRAFLAVIRGMGVTVEGIIDSDMAKVGALVEGVPVVPPSFLRGSTGPERPFVFVASMYCVEIFPQLEAMGYRTGEDFAKA